MLSYIDLSDYRFEEIVIRVSKSYPNSCIVSIQEISNPELLARFEKATIGQKTRLLFHGTKLSCITSIIKEGFRSELNVSSALGKGTYFAQDSSYSWQYTRNDTSISKEIAYMFLADVLVPEGSRPDIIVQPNDHHCYPRYVIAFHKK